MKITLTNYGENKETIILSEEILSIDRPSISFEADGDNIFGFWPKKATWLPIKMITNECPVDKREFEKQTGSQIQKQMNFFNSIAGTSDYKFNLLVEYDFDDYKGNYYLEGCFLSDANYGFDSNNAFNGQLTLTIRYDTATIDSRI